MFEGISASSPMQVQNGILLADLLLIEVRRTRLEAG